MSTEKTAPESKENATVKANTSDGSQGLQPEVKQIDVSALQIDETFDGDHDPYNSTGQFLADRVRDGYS